MTLLSRRLLLVCAAVISLALAGLFAGSASAASSRELLNGFDNDYHCVQDVEEGPGAEPGVCRFFNAMVPWIRGGAPDPSKPVLVLDRDGSTDPDCGNCSVTAPLELDASLDVALGDTLARQVVDPRSAQFASLPLDTAHWSAIIVASDEFCDGCDLNNDAGTPDTDAMQARRGDIVNFFRNGGGVMMLSGGSFSLGKTRTARGGQSDHCDPYYSVPPLTATCVPGSGSTAVTPAGAAIGLEDEFIDGPHNLFEEPDPASGLQVGARTTADNNEGTRGLSVPNTPELLFADVPLQPTIASAGSAAACNGSFSSSDPGGSGTKAIHFKANGGGEQVVTTDAAGNASAAFPAGTTSVEFWAEDQAGNQESPHHSLAVSGCAPPAKPAAPKIGVAGVRRACTSSSRLRVRFTINAPGKVKSVRITLDGKTIKRTTKSRFSLRINTKKLKAGRHRLRTVVTDQAGNTKTSTRTISVCKAAKPRRRAAPRFTG